MGRLTRSHTSRGGVCGVLVLVLTFAPTCANTASLPEMQWVVEQGPSFINVDGRGFSLPDVAGRTAGLLPPSHTEMELLGGRPPFCCPRDKGLRVAWPGFPCPEPALASAVLQIPIQVSAQCHLIRKACSYSPTGLPSLSPWP